MYIYIYILNYTNVDPKYEHGTPMKQFPHVRLRGRRGGGGWTATAAAEGIQPPRQSSHEAIPAGEAPGAAAGRRLGGDRGGRGPTATEAELP